MAVPFVGISGLIAAYTAPKRTRHKLRLGGFALDRPQSAIGKLDPIPIRRKAKPRHAAPYGPRILVRAVMLAVRHRQAWSSGMVPSAAKPVNVMASQPNLASAAAANEWMLIIHRFSPG